MPALVINHLFLSLIVLSIPYIAIMVQFMLRSLIEVMSSPFIRTARAKGLSVRWVIFVRAIKRALMAVLSFLGGILAG